MSWNSIIPIHYVKRTLINIQQIIEIILNSPCEQLLSTHGKEMLIHNNFVYNFDKKLSGNNHFWRCKKRRTHFCNGSITTTMTDGIYKVFKGNPHCHIADLSSIINLKFKAKIKTAASTTSETPARINQRHFSQLNEDESYCVPSLNTCRQMIKRLRKNELPSEPLCVDPGIKR